VVSVVHTMVCASLQTNRTYFNSHLKVGRA
jgi:hypothetical protein